MVKAAKEIVAPWLLSTAGTELCVSEYDERSPRLSKKMNLIMVLCECNYGKSKVLFHSILIISTGSEAQAVAPT